MTRLEKIMRAELIGAYILILLYCALQPRTYRSHETGGRVFVVQLPSGEAGFNSGFFYCTRGDC